MNHHKSAQLIERLGSPVAIGKIVPLLAFCFYGCGGANKLQELSSQALVTSLSCNGAMVGTTEPVSVQGQLQTDVNRSTAFTLSDNAGCTGAESVQWNAPSAKSTGVVGETLVSTYSQPGSYKVSADLSTQNQNLGTIVSTSTVIVGSQPVLVGPQVSFEFVDATYSVLLPSGYQLASIRWNFGDQSAPINSLTTVNKSYATAGSYLMSATVTDSAGQVTELSQGVQVLPFFEELLCAGSVGISGPVEVPAGQNGAYSLLLPQCLKDFSAQVSWNLGDNSSALIGETVNHSYAASGKYSIIASVTLTHPRVPSLTFTHRVTVLVSEVDLNKCQTEGETRESISGQRQENRSCGVQGQQVLSYQTRAQEQCQRVENHLDWVVVSQAEELVSTGICQSQSCEIAASAITGLDPNSLNLQLIGGKYYMSSGQSLSFYSTRNATDSCSTVAQMRSCSNGVLNGSSSYQELSCNNGCGSFGIHGTTQLGVITGEREIAKQCAYAETGFFDVFNELSDLTCNQGEIQSANIRLGNIKIPGVCPIYQWAATDVYSACTADCGGEQAREFICQDNKGNLSPSERCTEAKPIETRLCDANPEAVRKTEVSTTTEDSGSSTTCPSNQIGVIIQQRDVNTTQVYACINHTIAVESETTEYGEWIEERYCRDYVPHRCNHDSLSTGQAKARYDWMQKCRSQVPVIDEFLTEFDDVQTTLKTKNGKQTSSLTTGRLLYPTFMNHLTVPESVWKAPTSPNATCVVPAGIYVAAVCVSSCSTPEQEIMAQVEAKGSLKGTTFIEALTKNYGFVGTLHSNSTMSDKLLKKTNVDNWVTELVDSEHQILNFKMASGNTLRITPNHPLVNVQGQMEMADQFNVGDSLVKLGGVPDQIVEIRPEIYFGKVYNLFVKSNDLKHNVVVTNGYLNGTAFYQNEGAKNLNRQILRGRIVKGALPR